MEQSATVLADPDAMQKINRAYDELGTVYKNQQIKNLNPSDKRISTESTWGIYAETKAKTEEAYINADTTQEEINETVDTLLAGRL